MTLAFPINLSSSTFPVLTYWLQHFLPDCHNFRDHFYVEISEDGGITWTVLTDITCSNVTWYEPNVIDLSSYKTSPVKIRFRLLADGDGVVGDGVYIDDVEIKEMDIPTLPFPFSDDFESGLGNWSVSGSDWEPIVIDSVSPTHSITDSPDGNYHLNANSTMTLVHPVDLSPSTFPVLTYWLQHFLPDCHNFRDHFYVEISEDGGITWTVLTDITCSNATWYEPNVIDLSSYKTSPVKIRFRLLADGDGVVGDGVYIDDVKIFELCPCPFVDVTPDHWAHDCICAIFHAGITTGCSPTPPLYCPEGKVTRAQMAAFLARAFLGVCLVN